MKSGKFVLNHSLSPSLSLSLSPSPMLRTVGQVVAEWLARWSPRRRLLEQSVACASRHLHPMARKRAYTCVAQYPMAPTAAITHHCPQTDVARDRLPLTVPVTANIWTRVKRRQSREPLRHARPFTRATACTLHHHSLRIRITIIIINGSSFCTHPRKRAAATVPCTCSNWNALPSAASMGRRKFSFWLQLCKKVVLAGQVGWIAHC